MNHVATVIRYSSLVIAAVVSSLIIAPHASGALRFAWPALWLIVLLGFERHGALPGIIGAVVGGLALESVSVAPFGAILGPLVALAALYGTLKKVFFDPTRMARLYWSLIAIASFFILRSVWIHVADSGQSAAWTVLPAVIAINVAGYAVCAAGTRLINTYVFSRS